MDYSTGLHEGQDGQMAYSSHFKGFVLGKTPTIALRGRPESAPAVIFVIRPGLHLQCRPDPHRLRVASPIARDADALPG